MLTIVGTGTDLDGLLAHPLHDPYVGETAYLVPQYQGHDWFRLHDTFRAENNFLIYEVPA